ncbi:MAG: hypothetical protein CL759_06860 [Chloroflexi bacterium]|nr:hypothetical protein [Chloroflexota bacterium]|tara:strand:+ start:269 stop:490 length:222 start_codon:yes stop_codon:yes gene_type:complete
MSETYRACYIRETATNGECVLTGPEHAHLDDAALRAEAMAEATRAGLYRDDDPDCPTREAIAALLEIGDWTEL